jgi:hypothetical protein
VADHGLRSVANLAPDMALQMHVRLVTVVLVITAASRTPCVQLGCVAYVVACVASSAACRRDVGLKRPRVTPGALHHDVGER